MCTGFWKLHQRQTRHSLKESRGKFAIKHTPWCFNAVGTDMALEQTINKLQKSASGLVGNSRKKSYVTKWEILYNEVLAVTKLNRKISGLIQPSYHQDVNRIYSTACTDSDKRDIQAIIYAMKIHYQVQVFGKSS